MIWSVLNWKKKTIKILKTILKVEFTKFLKSQCKIYKPHFTYILSFQQNFVLAEYGWCVCEGQRTTRVSVLAFLVWDGTLFSQSMPGWLKLKLLGTPGFSFLCSPPLYTSPGITDGMLSCLLLHGTGDSKSVLTPAQQMLYPLSHLPQSPNSL